jgi:hypothetical protein
MKAASKRALACWSGSETAECGWMIRSQMLSLSSTSCLTYTSKKPPDYCYFPIMGSLKKQNRFFADSPEISRIVDKNPVLAFYAFDYNDTLSFCESGIP